MVVISLATVYTVESVSWADTWTVTVKVSVSVFALGRINLWSISPVLAVYLNVDGIPCVSPTPATV